MSPGRNWDSPNPSLARGLWESQFQRLEKKLSTLPTLCCAALSNYGVYRVSLYPPCHTLTDSLSPLTHPPPLFQWPLQLITLLTHSHSLIILKHSEMTSISTGLFLSLWPHFFRQCPFLCCSKQSFEVYNAGSFKKLKNGQKCRWLYVLSIGNRINDYPPLTFRQYL